MDLTELLLMQHSYLTGFVLLTLIKTTLHVQVHGVPLQLIHLHLSIIFSPSLLPATYYFNNTNWQYAADPIQCEFPKMLTTCPLFICFPVPVIANQNK